MKPRHIYLLLLLLLVGCSTNSNLTSFGTRKYTKGYFFDNPVKIEANSQVEIKAKVSTEQKTENKIAIIPNTKVTQEPVKALSPLKKTQLLSKQVMKLAVGEISKAENVTISRILPDDPQPDVDEKTGKPINWGLSALICGIFCLLAGILALIALNDFAGISVLLFVFVAVFSGVFAVLTAIHSIHINDGHILLAKIALVLCTISAILLLLLL